PCPTLLNLLPKTSRIAFKHGSNLSGKIPQYRVRSQRQSTHGSLAAHGVALRKRANGLVFVEAREGKQAMKASAFDRSCSKPSLEKRLGAFEPMKKKVAGMDLMATKRRYKSRPLLRGHPATGQLWRRYLTAKKTLARRPGLIGRALVNWKLFLLTEAYNDPMAMVLILAHQEMLNLLLGTGQVRAKHVPKTLEGPLAHWRQLAPAQVSRMNPQMATRPERAEQMQDGQGNVVAPRRNDQGMVVGLLVREQGGHFVALPRTVASSRARSNGPGSGLSVDT
ncbi:hypothetical protein ACSHT0_16250, partial [Tepidicaulis sp. LMO-SS28]|uniref:hypothetical protein n=1 Tax=Tepidicaulis sp. LMO-SS28 TaxID=3447455 RepID=UPI003EE07283